MTFNPLSSLKTTQGVPAHTSKCIDRFFSSLSSLKDRVCKAVKGLFNFDNHVEFAFHSLSFLEKYSIFHINPSPNPSPLDSPLKTSDIEEFTNRIKKVFVEVTDIAEAPVQKPSETRQKALIKAAIKIWGSDLSKAAIIGDSRFFTSAVIQFRSNVCMATTKIFETFDFRKKEKVGLSRWIDQKIQEKIDSCLEAHKNRADYLPDENQTINQKIYARTKTIFASLDPTMWAEHMEMIDPRNPAHSDSFKIALDTLTRFLNDHHASISPDLLRKAMNELEVLQGLY